MIPRLETDRLILRAFRENDLDAWAAIMADPDVMTYLGDVWFITRAQWLARQ